MENLFGERNRITADAKCALVNALGQQRAVPNKQQKTVGIKRVGIRRDDVVDLVRVERSGADAPRAALERLNGVEKAAPVREKRWPPMRFISPLGSSFVRVAACLHPRLRAAGLLFR